MIKIIVAFDKNRGIGYKGTIPWKVPGEMAWVAKKTKQVSSSNRKNALLMGRNTWDSLPTQPLPERLNVIISRTKKIDTDNAISFSSIDDAFSFFSENEHIEDIYIFGGSEIYSLALSKGIVDEIITTEIQGEFECDTWFQAIPESFKLHTEREYTYNNNVVKRRYYINGSTKNGDV
ncbi:dihydrofolate reductase [Vibrio splendidus]|uniref:dihydrofolate reductase n=1 Tax=Vibrio lentus TaxID=136468 RepID=A0A4U2F457_9VIBR|nr:dihydrofolate reductase [Vibrio lentus]PHN84027.1 dihydrofolate reductase [Vibrio splendidus]MCC4783970.1 dihydrofolate reductase [Vibrio lentus]MCC4854267.1 dihydrofolate reductase [Vibrio lentus]OMO26975.1 hypothetical protein BH583_18940 [Vibrio lentus]PME62467.1 hypothetical protein BCV33_03870 [Vibrio lentus]